jgi:hypothetical protein
LSCLHRTVQLSKEGLYNLGLMEAYCNPIFYRPKSDSSSPSALTYLPSIAIHCVVIFSPRRHDYISAASIFSC